MDIYTKNALEFPKVLEHFANFCRADASKEIALSLHPFESVEEVHESHMLFSEFQTWYSDSEFSVKALPNISFILKSFSSSTVLEIDDLWALKEVLNQGRNAYISLQDTEFVTLKNITEFLLPELSIASLNRCISDDAYLKDESSPELILVRTEKRTLQQNCTKKVKEYTEKYNITHYMQDDYMSIVADRYVLPLKSNFKGRLQGIIHDYSHSGETLYFEPMFLVDINNNLQRLIQQEREEEYKVLRLLTSFVYQEQESILSLWNLLIKLDLNNAKSLLSEAFAEKNGDRGRSVFMEDSLNLIGAKHPLLLLDTSIKKVEPIDITLRKEDQILVISGGNAGGKTVALKTLGLICLMTQAGLPVPVQPGSTLAKFLHIHAFIGDEQSLDEHVSTFTGQIQHLVQIWDTLDSNSLVLLDEFGAGTDPSQGAALAQAVLDCMIDIGAYAVTATHFPALKMYALTTEKVRAASVLFEPNTKKPLYRLAYDQVGASQAMDVARSHGLPETILAKASQYLLMDTSDMEGVVTRLNILATEREKELDDLRVESLRLKEKEKERRIKYEKERKLLGEDLRKQSQEITSLLKTEKITAKQALKQVSTLRANLNPENSDDDGNDGNDKIVIAKPEDFSVGQYVFYRPWKKAGILQEIDLRSKKIKINLDGVSLWTLMKDVDIPKDNKKILKEKFSNSATAIIYNHSPVSYRLDLRGKRADIALGELMQFLDTALLNAADQVEIIHGKGTGVLRKSVHEFLKNYPAISSFTLATEEFGGDGVTIVNFK